MDELLTEWREASTLADDLQRQLTAAAVRRAAVVRALLAEGRTVRQVAELLGVSHQRISQLSAQYGGQ